MIIVNEVFVNPTVFKMRRSVITSTFHAHPVNVGHWFLERPTNEIPYTLIHIISKFSQFGQEKSLI